MAHAVAQKANPIHRSSQGPRPRRGLAAVLACVIGLWIGLPAAHAKSRHTDRSQEVSGRSSSPIWRCSDAQGRTRYSQQPCDGGTALTHLSDTRTAAQREQAADMQERDNKLLRRLGRERHHQALLAKEQGHASLSPTRPRHVATSTPNAHAPVPLQRCRPPACFTARLPKDKSPGKSAPPAATSASS